MTDPQAADAALIARLREVNRLLYEAGSVTITVLDSRKQGSLLTEAADALAAQARELEQAEAALAERDKLLLDVAASLAAAVNLLEYSCDCKDRLLDQKLKDYAASVERVRAYYAAIAAAKDA